MAPERRWKLLNPLRGVRTLTEAGSQGAPVERALEVLKKQRPDLEVAGRTWFGWELPEQPRGRYLAVGNDQRGYVVDAVSGHVLWERAIESRRDLPRSLTALH
ncbi:MAG TPA: hypothetical protein VFW18_01850 [Gaiellales bacterium]|nr:hypothetical protein [Gaiellales bacterium]